MIPTDTTIPIDSHDSLSLLDLGSWGLSKKERKAFSKYMYMYVCAVFFYHAVKTPGIFNQDTLNHHHP